ncbi:hypothetical protein FRC04_002531 [Tulasnella sp. 424]|nr:hypothetical protein FRC04_002531 [Tulasnella sp. 424]
MAGSCPHCSARFKFMNGDEICGRCKLYISYDKKEIPKEEAERGNMCLACGKVWGRLADADGPCGECIDRDEKMIAIQHNYERLREIASRILNHGLANPFLPRLLESRPEPPSMKSASQMRARTSAISTRDYGPTEVFATVLLDLFTRFILPWWKQSQQVKLTFEDVTWSFSTTKIKIDNIFFDPEEAKTLGNFVATFAQPEKFGQFFASKEMKKSGGGVKQTKRKVDDFSSSEEEGAIPGGRPVTRASAKVPQSPEKFVEKRVAPSTRQIVFRKRYAAVYGKTWAVREPGGEPISGTVTETAFNTSGETKDVFILRVGEEEFAAKQFKDSILPSDDTRTNLTFLEGELVRAAILQTQLQGFRRHVRKVPGVGEIVDIHPFAIPQTFIAREVTLIDGMKQHYICEPLRSRAEKPVKFSGVNQAGRNAGAAGGTADALAHYSLIASRGNLVLVDLQAMRVLAEMKNDGIAVLALFDPMCHMSRFGGDRDMFFHNNGDAGIEAWKAQHRCNAICQALGLDKIEPTAPDDQRPSATQTVLAIDDGEDNKPGEQFFEAQVDKPEPPKYDHVVRHVE